MGDEAVTGLTGGCQCGAVRFACDAVRNASICHCRMCQKAFGNAFSALGRADGLVWTRGKPAIFESSNLATRGFCPACGTPLTYSFHGSHTSLALGAFDDPSRVPPLTQYEPDQRVPWVDTLRDLPAPSTESVANWEVALQGLSSRQHPDHDTAEWPPRVKA